MSSEKNSGNASPSKAVGPKVIKIMPQQQTRPPNQEAAGSSSGIPSQHYRAAIGKGTFYRIPSGVAQTSVNRTKLGNKTFPNPFASKKILKRLKSLPFLTPSSSGSSSTASGTGYPLKKPVTSQDLRKTLERRILVKAQAEKARCDTIKIPLSSVAGLSSPESPKLKRVGWRDDDDSSTDSTTVQIGGAKKSTPPKKTNIELEKEKKSFQGVADVIDISSDEEEIETVKDGKADGEDRKTVKVSSSAIGAESAKKIKVAAKEKTKVIAVKTEHGAGCSTEKPSSSTVGQPETTQNKSDSPSKSLQPLMTLLLTPKKDTSPRSSLIRKETDTSTADKMDKVKESQTRGGAMVKLAQQQSRVRSGGNEIPNPAKVLARDDMMIPRIPFPPPTGPALLPTPSVFQRLGKKITDTSDNSNQGGSGNAGGMWRTYDQAKKSEFTSYKKKYQNKSTPSKFQQNWQMNQQREWDTNSDFGSGMQMPTSDFSTSRTVENEDKLEKRRNANAKGSNMLDSSSGGGGVFDPFQRIPLAPAAPSALISQMYEEMLWHTDATMPPPPFRFTNAREVELFAENKSLASFLRTDSRYGNALMPVLPRIPPPPPASSSPGMLSDPRIKS